LSTTACDARPPPARGARPLEGNLPLSKQWVGGDVHVDAVRCRIPERCLPGQLTSPTQAMCLSRAVATDQIVDIFAAAGLKKPDISILPEEFLGEVQGMPQRNLAVEMRRKLLDGEIGSPLNDPHLHQR